MEYLEDSLVDGYKVEWTAQFGEAIQFAVHFRENRGERDDNELRQAAQDALGEIMPTVMDAMVEAYRRSPLKVPDFEAVSLLFKQLAIRAKLLELCGRSPDHPDQFPTVKLVTRKRDYAGILYDMISKDGQEVVHLGVVAQEAEDGSYDRHDEFVPLVSVQELHS